MNQPIVVFDTNVLESRYLKLLLGKQSCIDILFLKDKGYQAAISVKTLYEIWLHAKLGKGNKAWQQKEFGYPGSLQEAVQRILMPLIPVNHLDPERTGYYWFNQCEEWRWNDWNEEIERLRRFVKEPEQEKVIKELKAQEEFTVWKSQMESFCCRIFDKLEEADFRIIYNHEVYSSQHYSILGLQLEQDLALHSLVPNEDLEILFACICLNTVAFVTNENKILDMSRLSMGLGLNSSPGRIPSMVHPNQFHKALEQDFCCAQYLDD